MDATGGDHPTDLGDVAQPHGRGHRAVRPGEPADLDGLRALREARAWRDDAFRASELWGQRRHADVPAELVARFERAHLAYFDQLVARPGRAWGSARLAFHHMVDAMQRHDALLATTVVEPVANGAARRTPVRRVGGRA